MLLMEISNSPKPLMIIKFSIASENVNKNGNSQKSRITSVDLSHNILGEYIMEVIRW